MIFSETRPQIVCSASAICSAVSAIDHLSGAALNFHCASETPSIAARKSFCVCLRYATARSRSSFVNVLDSVVAVLGAAGAGEVWPQSGNAPKATTSRKKESSFMPPSLARLYPLGDLFRVVSSSLVSLDRVWSNHGHHHFYRDRFNERRPARCRGAWQRGELSPGCCDGSASAAGRRASKLWRRRCRAGTVRLFADRAGSLHLDDGRSICAAQEPAAREYHRLASSFAYPCEGLRGMRN